MRHIFFLILLVLIVPSAYGVCCGADCAPDKNICCCPLTNPNCAVTQKVGFIGCEAQGQYYCDGDSIYSWGLNDPCLTCSVTDQNTLGTWAPDNTFCQSVYGGEYSGPNGDYDIECTTNDLDDPRWTDCSVVPGEDKCPEGTALCQDGYCRPNCNLEPSCSQMNGVICPELSSKCTSLDGIYLDMFRASDTNRCCIGGTCKLFSEQETCSELGGRVCIDYGTKCVAADGRVHGFSVAKDTNRCCIGTCETPDQQCPTIDDICYEGESCVDDNGGEIGFDLTVQDRCCSSGTCSIPNCPVPECNPGQVCVHSTMDIGFIPSLDTGLCCVSGTCTNPSTLLDCETGIHGTICNQNEQCKDKDTHENIGFKASINGRCCPGEGECVSMFDCHAEGCQTIDEDEVADSCLCSDCGRERDYCGLSSDGAELYCINGLCSRFETECSTCSTCDNLEGGCTFDRCVGECSIGAGSDTSCYYRDNDCYECSDTATCELYGDERETCLADPCEIYNCRWDGTRCITFNDLIVIPSSAELQVGASIPLRAEYSINENVYDVTNETTFTSLDSAIIGIDHNIATASKTGERNIRAEYTDKNGRLHTAVSSIHGIPQSERVISHIEIKPHTAKLDIGNKVSYSTMAYYSNAEYEDVSFTDQTTYLSTEEEVARWDVSSQKTDFMAYDNGSTIISANYRYRLPREDSSYLKVIDNSDRLLSHILIDNGHFTRNPGVDIDLTVVAFYSDGSPAEFVTDKCSFASTYPEVANVSRNTVTMRQAGLATIVATYKFGGTRRSDAITVKVTDEEYTDEIYSVLSGPRIACHTDNERCSEYDAIYPTDIFLKVMGVDTKDNERDITTDARITGISNTDIFQTQDTFPFDYNSNSYKNRTIANGLSRITVGYSNEVGNELVKHTILTVEDPDYSAEHCELSDRSESDPPGPEPSDQLEGNCDNNEQYCWRPDVTDYESSGLSSCCGDDTDEEWTYSGTSLKGLLSITSTCYASRWHDLKKVFYELNVQ